MRTALSVILILLFVGCGDVASKARGASDNIQLNADAIPQRRFQNWYLGVWQHTPIEIRFDSSTNQSQATAFSNAIRTWNDAAGFELMIIHSDRIDHPPAMRYDEIQGDGMNSILFIDDWSTLQKRGDVIGTTFWRDDEGSAEGVWGELPVMSQGDIVLNRNGYDFGDTETSRKPGAKSFVDSETIALHELGHLIGLSHIWKDDPDSVMLSFVITGEGKHTRRVSEGDRERLKFLYVEGAPVPGEREPTND